MQLYSALFVRISYCVFIRFLSYIYCGAGVRPISTVGICLSTKNETTQFHSKNCWHLRSEQN